MLKTEFRVAIVGLFVRPIWQVLLRGLSFNICRPARPRCIRRFTNVMLRKSLSFTEQLDFLKTLLDMGSAPVDGLVAAVLRHCYQLRKLGPSVVGRRRPYPEHLS